jgi:hypothetical protein|tara:strand:+ start:7636 stop:7932 length:297 start_codon:yes stop_codon:yes gene_type:complete
MENLEKLIKSCKASVSILVNNHRDYYQSVQEYIGEHVELYDLDISNEIGLEVFTEMIRKNTVIEITAYPDTPNGNYSVYHHDIIEAIQLINKAITAGK